MENGTSSNNIVVKIRSETNYYDDGYPGYQVDGVITAEYRGKKYTLVFQAAEPVYLSGDFMARQDDGYTTGPFGLNNESGDEHQGLVDAMVENGDAEDDDAAIALIMETFREDIRGFEKYASEVGAASAANAVDDESRDAGPC